MTRSSVRLTCQRRDRTGTKGEHPSVWTTTFTRGHPMTDGNPKPEVFPTAEFAGAAPSAAAPIPAAASIGLPPKDVHDQTSRVIGSYRVLDVLGRGGMGVVYRARQANPSRDVALKVIGLSFVNDQLLRRFELEAQTLGRLKH